MGGACSFEKQFNANGKEPLVQTHKKALLIDKYNLVALQKLVTAV